MVIDVVYQGRCRLSQAKQEKSGSGGVILSFHHDQYGCVQVPRNGRRKDARKLIPTAIAFHVVTGSSFWK